MNKKLLLASTGAAVIAAAGFGSIALAQEDTPSGPADEQTTAGPTGELDAVPDDATAGDGQELFESDGGTVLAECTDDGPELVWWAPAEGYTVDDVEAVPDDDDDGDRDDDAEVEFENGSLEVDYDVTCADGQPQANVTTEDDSDDDSGDHDDDDDDDGKDDDSGDDGDDDSDDDD